MNPFITNNLRLLGIRSFIKKNNKTTLSFIPQFIHMSAVARRAKVEARRALEEAPLRCSA